MPVVQLTVQLVAGRANLGAAAASVQFSRSVGAAFGTAIVGAVLFAVLSATDRGTAVLFAEHGGAGAGCDGRAGRGAPGGGVGARSGTRSGRRSWPFRGLPGWRW